MSSSLVSSYAFSSAIWVERPAASKGMKALTTNLMLICLCHKLVRAFPVFGSFYVWFGSWTQNVNEEFICSLCATSPSRLLRIWFCVGNEAQWKGDEWALMLIDLKVLKIVDVKLTFDWYKSWIKQKAKRQEVVHRNHTKTSIEFKNKITHIRNRLFLIWF